MFEKRLPKRAPKAVALALAAGTALAACSSANTTTPDTLANMPAVSWLGNAGRRF
ncbi:MAG TPA: hypothetical protein VIM53_01085 [Candidatus Saccharimonadales bacterium]